MMQIKTAQPPSQYSSKCMYGHMLIERNLPTPSSCRAAIDSKITRSFQRTSIQGGNNVLQYSVSVGGLPPSTNCLKLCNRPSCPRYAYSSRPLLLPPPPRLTRGHLPPLLLTSEAACHCWSRPYDSSPPSERANRRQLGSLTRVLTVDVFAVACVWRMSSDVRAWR